MKVMQMEIDVRHEKQMLSRVDEGNLDHKVQLFSAGLKAQVDRFSGKEVCFQDEQGRWMPLGYFVGTGNERSSHSMRSLPSHEQRKELHEQYAAIVKGVVPEQYQDQFLAELQERLPVYKG